MEPLDSSEVLVKFEDVFPECTAHPESARAFPISFSIAFSRFAFIGLSAELAMLPKVLFEPSKILEGAPRVWGLLKAASFREQAGHPVFRAGVA